MIALIWMLLWWLVAVGALLLFNYVLGKFIESLIPPQGRFIEVDGLRLHVVDSGEKPGQVGPPLVFVHGLLGQLNHFSYALAALFPERRVVLIDRPGSGYSQPAPSQSLQAQGDLVAKLIAKLDLQKPLVIGHSLGGAISLALALDHPEAIGGVALIAPLTLKVTAPPSPFESLARRSPLARWLWAWTLGPAASMLTSGAALKTVFAPETDPIDYWNRGGGLFSARPWTLHAASRDMAGLQGETAAQSARYATLAVPVAVLYGVQDHILEAKLHGETFCLQTPHAELKLIEGGHMLPLTQPKAVEAFIRSRLPSNPS
jgi:pimeloyl-ACP methyl ester carboxylesterase